MACRGFDQVPLNLCLDPYFPVVYVSFKEDGVDSLGEIGWGGQSRIGQFGEVSMGKLGPDLVVIEFCVGFGVRFSNLGWEIDPCHHMIQCRLTPLALPRVLLLCVGVSSGTVEEVFKFVIRRS